MTSHSRERLRFQKGLCLAEVLVSSFIVLTGVSAILSSFLSGRFCSSGARHWTQGMNLARARIEYYKSLSYADLSSMPGVTVEPSVPLDQGDGANSIESVVSTGISQQDDGISITVFVCWDERTAGAGRTPWVYKLKTWVSSPGPPPGT